jgi:FtsH-binding integral membrane protein
MTDPRYLRHVPADRQGRRDTMMIGFGIVALGILGFLGMALALVRGNFSAQTSGLPVVVICGGAILLMLARSLVAAIGIRERHGALAGLAGGCGSVALSIGLGALLFVASMIFLVVSCTATVMTGASLK